MSKLLRGKKLGRSVLAVALLLLSMAVSLTMPPPPAHADDGNSYPWSGAVQVPGTPGTINPNILWGYTTCPSSDTNCMAGNIVGSDGKTYGYADPWGYALRYCTSWVAWALHDRNGFEMPHAIGDATYWKPVLNSAPYNYPANQTPAIGAIAWFSGIDHVAWVSNLNPNGTVQIEEYNNPAGSGAYYSPPRSITASSAWYIHVKDLSSNPPPTPSTPAAVSRSSSDMTVFYDDGVGGLVSWSWSSSSGWSSYTWKDTFGTDNDHIIGVPAVVARDSGDMDVFYRTGDGRLIHRGWNSVSGWEGPDTELSSGVAGDPAVVSRDSGDLQIFFRTTASEMKTISWNSTTGWNTNPVNLYSSNVAGDPGAVARTSSSMDVFFQKSNGDPVHLGWTSSGGWNNNEQVVSTAMVGKPGVISRNTGGDMSADYRESNGHLAEWWWNSTAGWGWTDWSANLAGPPSVTPDLPTTINSFYRETGGNINDHNFGGFGWSTATIVGAGGATGDPFALVRGGSSLETFYWSGTALMDEHWNAVNGWGSSQIN